MQAIARLKPAVKVLGIIPSAENMPGGGSYRPGDIITAVDGQPVTGIREVLDQVTGFKPGRVVELAVIREDAQYSVTLTVTERPQ